MASKLRVDFPRAGYRVTNHVGRRANEDAFGVALAVRLWAVTTTTVKRSAGVDGWSHPGYANSLL